MSCWNVKFWSTARPALCLHVYLSIIVSLWWIVLLPVETFIWSSGTDCEASDDAFCKEIRNSCFLCSFFGKVITSCTNYVQGWIKFCKRDWNIIMQTGNLAVRYVDCGWTQVTLFRLCRIEIFCKCLKMTFHCFVSVKVDFYAWLTYELFFFNSESMIDW